MHRPHETPDRPFRTEALTERDAESMVIREFHSSDLDRCALIYERAWNSAFPTRTRCISPKQLGRETRGETMIVAEEDGEVLGFASVWQPNSFLHHLHVDPDHQRRGVGTALLEQVAQSTSAAVSLKCQVGNGGALSFYAKLGFIEEAERGEDEFGEWVRLTQRE